MAERIVAFLDGFSPETVVFLISLVPVIELRGAIPVGIAMGLPAWRAFLAAVLGNGLIALLLLLLLPPFFRLLDKISFLQPRLDRLIARTNQKSAQINKKGFWGLLLFVAIPLPGTGVWTGAFIAYLMGMRIRHALPAVVLGMILAGVLMTLASLGIFSLAGSIEWALAAILVLLIVVFIWQRRRHRD